MEGESIEAKKKPQDNFDFSLSNFRNQTTSSSKILKIIIITYPPSPILWRNFISKEPSVLCFWNFSKNDKEAAIINRFFDFVEPWLKVMLSVFCFSKVIHQGGYPISSPFKKEKSTQHLREPLLAGSQLWMSNWGGSRSCDLNHDPLGGASTRSRPC